MKKYSIRNIVGRDKWNGLKTELGTFDFEASDNLSEKELRNIAEMECETRHSYDYDIISFSVEEVKNG